MHFNYGLFLTKDNIDIRTTEHRVMSEMKWASCIFLQPHDCI